MALFLSKKKKIRTVFVIKHPTETYIIRSSFFKNRRRQLDINMPKEGEFEWAKKIASLYIKPAGLMFKVGEQGHFFSDVRLGSPPVLFDVRLVIIHVSADHHVDWGEGCTRLSDDPPLCRLFQKRIKGTHPEDVQKAS